MATTPAPSGRPRRRVLSNPLALAVLTLLAEQPRHPYDMAQTLRSRRKEGSIRINFGSLYTVVQNLEKHGFIEASGTERAGRRPERTVYAITESGRAEMHDWLSELLRTPAKEYPQFEAGLSLMGVLPPDEVIALLAERQQALDAQLASEEASLGEIGGVLPRIFLIEGEYQLALLRAEAEWLRQVRAELEAGTFDGLAGWRQYHETGEVPAEFAEFDRQAKQAERGEQSTQGAARHTHE
ncbi:PadR family transcriptional regulator [Streptacidiphilus monticola]|uniref:PadR family transcriptional regulator n=1 Tax=Streptacidiphilus monticola TaxID=2161674 RepID=A0ABW1G7J3_9ACTN